MASHKAVVISCHIRPRAHAIACGTELREDRKETAGVTAAGSRGDPKLGQIHKGPPCPAS